jgi:hypothetical protein
MFFGQTIGLPATPDEQCGVGRVAQIRIRPSSARFGRSRAGYPVVAENHVAARGLEPSPCDPLATREAVGALLTADLVIQGDASRAQ